MQGEGFYCFSYDLVALIIRRTEIIENSPELLQAIVANVLRPGWYSTSEAQELAGYIEETQVGVSITRETYNDAGDRRAHWYVQESEKSLLLRKIEGSYSGLEFSDYNPLTGITTTTTY